MHDAFKSALKTFLFATAFKRNLRLLVHLLHCTVAAITFIRPFHLSYSTLAYFYLLFYFVLLKSYSCFFILPCVSFKSCFNAYYVLCAALCFRLWLKEPLNFHFLLFHYSVWHCIVLFAYICFEGFVLISFALINQ